MKVLMVGPNVQEIGGISTHISELISGDYIDVDWATFEWSTAGNFDVKQAKGIISRILRLCYGLKRFFQLLTQRASYDVIHFHVSSYFGFWEKVGAAIIMTKLGMKVAVTIHGGEFSKFYDSNPKAIRFALEKLSLVLFVNKEHFEIFSGSEKFKYVPNPIGVASQPIFAAMGGPTSVANSNPTMRCVWTGNFEERKQPIAFIQSLARAFDLDKTLEQRLSVTMFGDGELLCKAKTAADGYPIDLPGAISNAELKHELQTYDTLICTSQNESFGYSIAEGMKFGLNIISTRVGILEHADSNTFWEIDTNLSDLTRVVSQVLHCEPRIRDVKRLRANDLIDEYSTDRVSRMLYSAYQNAID